MTLLELWKEKYSAGEIRFDADLLVIKAIRADDSYSWGTVLYSEAREQYKNSISRGEGNTTFDLDLMDRLRVDDFGGLIIAANPNSLFEGHLVIYPKTKSAEPTRSDLFDITRLAHQQPGQTFIYNMERSAASILDWAHYQAYPINFSIEKAEQTLLGDAAGLRVARVEAGFPAYALMLESPDAGSIARMLGEILSLLENSNNPHKKRIPVNFIWKKDRTWVIPRALNQSELAAKYFGGLEMGGIFCLPNANELRQYLPDALRNEISAATLACEPETQKWFEENVLRLLCETV